MTLKHKKTYRTMTVLLESCHFNKCSSTDGMKKIVFKYIFLNGCHGIQLIYFKTMNHSQELKKIKCEAL